MSKRGSLVCVGVGMTLGSHLTPLCRSYIEQADVVFTGLSDGVMELWIAQMHPDVRSLQQYYREGKPRTETYREMVEAMMTEVRAGKKVCGAFYGHPTVFALPPRKAVAVARSEGFDAHMEPGVSAEDCLYADLGIDPGEVGCAHYEASQFMFYRRRIDPSAYLILWQIGIAGDQSVTRFSTGAQYRQVLVDLLSPDYDGNHEVIAYKAATLPTQRPRMDRMKLRDLPKADLDIHFTLVIPPARALAPNTQLRRELSRLDRTEKGAAGKKAAAFSTDRLHMRLIDECDRELFCALYSDPSTMQLIGPALTRAAALRGFGKALRLSRERSAAWRSYAIVDTASGETLGFCGFNRSKSPTRRIEAGIILRPEARGRGYGREAFDGLVRHALLQPAIARVFARTAPANAPMTAVLQSVGFSECNITESTSTWSIARTSVPDQNSRRTQHDEVTIHP